MFDKSTGKQEALNTNEQKKSASFCFCNNLPYLAVVRDTPARIIKH